MMGQLQRVQVLPVWSPQTQEKQKKHVAQARNQKERQRKR
jgi:hypothetical protein